MSTAKVFYLAVYFNCFIVLKKCGGKGEEKNLHSFLILKCRKYEKSINN
jgi:hypothetical protein